MATSLFDSSALLAVIKKETGYQKIEPYLNNSFICSVNYCEVITILCLGGMSLREAEDIIRPLVQEIMPFDAQLASMAGELSVLTKELGLSLGDRACLTTAMYFDYEVITADKIWQKLKLPVKLKLIR